MSSNLGNKETMAKNIKYYMSLNGVNSLEMCRILGVPQSTFSYWITAKSYPRIDKIEKMANYFHISKADLVEERSFRQAVAFADEELRLIECWRLATDEQRQNIAFILRDYGMPFPEVGQRTKVSQSSGG